MTQRRLIMMSRRGARQTSYSPEGRIIRLWQNHLRDRTDLVTEDGIPIRIVYPGRVNGDQGADLLDAVIANGQRLIKGDIEFHVKSSSWRAHGHDRNPAYNRVILHVVLRCDAEVTTRLQNGKEIPTLEIDKYLKNPDTAYRPSGSIMPCKQAIKHRDTHVLGELLDRAGKERFLAKAAGFQIELNYTEANQTLYQGIMGALGYAKNKAPFLELARRLPLQDLESVTQSGTPEAECLARQQALLLGTAGLLPSQYSNGYAAGKSDGWLDKLESIWASTGQVETMSEHDWHFAKVRPSNLPPRRMVAMSHLVLRFREKGMLNEVVTRIRETPTTSYGQALEKLLLVTSDGYWASHLDFFLPSRQRIPTLLGGRRAADTVVNVLLPFAFAWGRFTAQPKLSRKSLAFYHHYPRLTVNVVEKHMSHQLGLNSDLIDSARRQQGLIHIYQTRCSQGKCRRCPLCRTIN